MYSPPRLPQARERQIRAELAFAFEHLVILLQELLGRLPLMIMFFEECWCFFLSLFLSFCFFSLFLFFYGGGHTDGQGMSADKKGIQLTCHDALVPAVEYLEQRDRERRKNIEKVLLTDNHVSWRRSMSLPEIFLRYSDIFQCRKMFWESAYDRRRKKYRMIF